ncbi:hypothetical protein SEVIR_5G385050v4 [Setaria viridis]
MLLLLPPTRAHAPRRPPRPRRFTRTRRQKPRGAEQVVPWWTDSLRRGAIRSLHWLGPPLLGVDGPCLSWMDGARLVPAAPAGQRAAAWARRELWWPGSSSSRLMADGTLVAG